MTTPTLVTTTQQADNGYAPLRVTSSNNPVTQTVELLNPTASTVIATVFCPLSAQESSRTWTAANVTGTVAGLDASGTDTISDTVTLEAGEKCRWTLVSTYSTSPVDTTNETIDSVTSTIIFTVTETTIAGDAVTDQDPVNYPLRSAYFGSKRPGPFFPVRTRNAEQFVSALFERMDDGQVQRAIDWLEAGHSFADLVVPKDTARYAFFDGHTTAATAKETALFVAPANLRITAVEWIPSANVTGDNTNYFTLNIRNRTTAGAGTAIPAALAFVTGVDGVASVPKDLTLSGTAASLLVTKGDVITANKAVTASGLACPSGLVVVHYTLR